jgi:hypothetical protein
MSLLPREKRPRSHYGATFPVGRPPGHSGVATESLHQSHLLCGGGLGLPRQRKPPRATAGLFVPSSNLKPNFTIASSGYHHWVALPVNPPSSLTAANQYMHSFALHGHGR